MKKFCFVLGFVFSISVLVSQSIYFNYSDGTSNNYNLTDVRKIIFNNDVMQLHLNDGSTFNWNVSTINHYEYSQNTGIEQILDFVNFHDVKVYPNPLNKLLNVSYNLPISDKVLLEICDYTGKLLIRKDLGTVNKGNHIHQLNTTKLSSGIYILTIKGKRSSISKKIIKK